MTSFHMRKQQAQIIQNADTIHNHPTQPAEDHRAAGIRAVAEQRYKSACHHFEVALDRNSPDPELLFYSALALLAGTRPHRHSKATVLEVDRRLQSAGDRPEALVLRALVADDYAQSWRRHATVPDSVAHAIRRVSEQHRTEIVWHVPAPESRIWRALNVRSS